MNSFVIFLTPLAFLLPAVPAALPEVYEPGEETQLAAAAVQKTEDRFSAAPAMSPRLLEDARRTETAFQVRIEQRVIVRIAPSSPQRARRSFAELDAQASGFEEERLGTCVPINMIAAAAPHENRLLLFMRDQRILSARLERACNPEDFYSGFYIERQDGQLCESRDRLQSRAGASCRVARLSRLVPVRD